MASLQEPEVQLAQRLASNQKPIRTRAMKKLRKYVQLRSQKVGGGFTLDELLKLWKGLFYCLWMQDKPLLQMDLSKLIAAMIHNFQNLDAQLLYLQASLQTFKREWNGIDRLRMDKFFQLVRYMFHQSFELLKRRTWDSRGVDGFLQLLNDELLQNGCDAPSGLQIHVLDVYLTELAAVGAQELTADQNLQFIKPFCRIAAETKNLVLFRSICNNIFSTITNQAPFAIEDLIKELKRAKTSDLGQDSDSGQASEEDLENEDQVKIQKKETEKNASVKQMNGKRQHDEDDDDELLNLEDLDCEVLADEDDICPVLQFDYGAIADKLLELASHQNVPSRNRKKLYKVIKIFRNLSEGIFPQERRSPEELSSDEEDAVKLDSRNILKRAREMLGVGDAAPAAKKRRRKKKKKNKGQTPAEALDRENGGEEAEQLEKEGKKKKKRKRNKKTKLIADEQNSEVNERATGETPVDQTDMMDVEDGPAISDKDLGATSNTAPKGKKKDRKRDEAKMNAQETGSGELTDTMVPTVSQSSETTTPVKKAHKPHMDPSPPEQVESCDITEEALPMPKRTKKNKCLKKTLKSSSLNAEVAPEGCESGEATAPSGAPSLTETQFSTGEVKKGAENTTTSMLVGRRKVAVVTEDGDEDPPVLSCKVAKKKKKKIIPVLFEFEADEVMAMNGAGKTTDLLEDAVVLTPTSSKKKIKTKSKSGFVTFQEKCLAPRPLFCKTKVGQETPKNSKKVKKTPKSESKKVTFHLLKNQTAEFRKSDRSLLLSPDGPSRVAFDPEQKPKSGVLKSPLTPDTPRMSARRKTTEAKTQRRPSAADFF